MEIIARINPKYFAATNLFAAVNDARYYLNGVFIEAHPVKGAIIVATDGHTLGLLHDPDGWVAEPIIVGNITKQLISACSVKGSEKRMTVPKLLYISQSGAVVSSDHEVKDLINPFAPQSLHMSKIQIIDGKFPDYRRVIGMKREETDTAFPCVNSAYLARLSAVAKLLIDTKYGHGVALMSSGRNAKVIARFTACELEHRFLGLLMPVRTDAPTTLLPDWLMPKDEAEQPA